jgi:hypothetical protein
MAYYEQHFLLNSNKDNQNSKSIICDQSAPITHINSDVPSINNYKSSERLSNLSLILEKDYRSKSCVSETDNLGGFDNKVRKS